MSGLTCPKCGKSQHTVLETRLRNGTIRRRRKCFKCGHRFWTAETIELGRMQPAEER